MMNAMLFLTIKRCAALLLTMTLTAFMGRASDAGNDSIRYYVYYDLKHVHTTNTPEDTLKNEMLLVVGASSSYFVSYDKFKFGSDLHQRIAEERKRAALTRVPFN